LFNKSGVAYKPPAKASFSGKCGPDDFQESCLNGNANEGADNKEFHSNGKSDTDQNGEVNGKLMDDGKFVTPATKVKQLDDLGDGTKGKPWILGDVHKSATSSESFPSVGELCRRASQEGKRKRSKPAKLNDYMVENSSKKQYRKKEVHPVGT
jgi:hypothetical protein